MMKMSLGIVGLVLVGFCGCGGGAPGEAAAVCDPTGTWNFTTSEANGNECPGDYGGTATKIVTVANGTATITNTSDGSTQGEAALDGACHMRWVTAVATTGDVGIAATGTTDCTFTGSTMTGTVSGNASATDGSMCKLELKLIGVRH